MNKLCPRCGQGELVYATIVITGEQVVVCDDCEALWKRGIVVSDDNFIDMSTYLERQGFKDGWKSLHVEGRWLES